MLGIDIKLNKFSSKTLTFAILAPALLAGFFVSLASPVRAYSESVDQSQTGCSGAYNMNGERIWAQSFTPSSTNITSIALRAGKLYDSGYISDIRLCKGDLISNKYQDANADWNCDNFGQEMVGILKAPALENAGWPRWKTTSFNYPVNIELGERYFFIFKGYKIEVCGTRHPGSYDGGEARGGAEHFSFKTYYSPDASIPGDIIPDPISDLRGDDYYNSGDSIKIDWTVPNNAKFNENAFYQIKYQKKISDCQTEFDWISADSIPSITASHDPGRSTSTVVLALEKDTHYCLAVKTHNGANWSEVSNIAEASTWDKDGSEALDQVSEGYKGHLNLNLGGQIFAQTFVPEEDNINSLSVKMKAQASPGRVYEIRVCSGEMVSAPQAHPTADWNCDNSGQKLVVSHIPGNNGHFTDDPYSFRWRKFDFDTKALEPGQKHFFMVKGYKLSFIYGSEGVYPQGTSEGSFNERVGDLNFKTYHDPFWEPQPERDPVIIVPGIIGSYLDNATSSEEIWMNIGNPLDPTDRDNMFWSTSDEYLNDLVLENDGQGGINLVPSDMLRSVLSKNLFFGLINELEDNNYIEGEDLFVFPYDWRLDLNYIAGHESGSEVNNLKQMIENVKASTSAEKVDIIAHSMGGLVVKTYIANYQYEGAKNNIDKFIDIATPHYGAPKAFKILNNGDDLGIRLGVEGFGVGLNAERLLLISQNMPSIYQLLPSQEYFNIEDKNYESYFSNYAIFENGNMDIGIGDNQLPIGDLNYEQTIEFMGKMGRNSYLLPYNEELHSKIDDIEIDNSFNIIGCGISTIGKMKALNWKWAFDLDSSLLFEKEIETDITTIDGDGTVPLLSAEAFGDKKYYVKKVKHAEIPSADGVKELIAAILDDRDEEFDINDHSKLIDMSECGLRGKLFGIFSPIELHVYDDQGRHTGPNKDGEIEMNIPGVEYETFGENKFAFLPDDGEYRIVGQAIGTGTFDVRVKEIENNEKKKTIYFSEIPIVSTSTNFTISVESEQAQYVLNIDEDGDGQFEEAKEADSILDEEEQKDTVKPETTINISGVIGNNDYYISSVTIDLSAHDPEEAGFASGILNTKCSLDNGQTWQSYQDSIIFNESGTGTIIYYSIDRAGNKEMPKTEVVKIDKEVPMIDIIYPNSEIPIFHSGILDIEYLLTDDHSGIATDTVKIYFDNEQTDGREIDLFYRSLGEHFIKIIASDQAGNEAQTEISFEVIADITSLQKDADRAYAEELMNNKAYEKITRDIDNIAKHIERAGIRDEKRTERQEEMLARCTEKKGSDWCEDKLGKAFDRVNGKLDKISEKFIKLKYRLLSKKLDIYLRLGWMSREGYDIIKNDIEYLINK